MFCPHCHAEVETTVRTVSEVYPVKGEDTTICAHVRFCLRCDTELWDEELDSQNLMDAYTAYRKKHRLLQPAEIRAIREKYGLSQTAFARVLGLGDKTITRYENGSVADTAQNNLIELMNSPGNFEVLLRKSQGKLSEQEYATACAAINALRGLLVVYPPKTVKYNISERADLHYSTNWYGGDRLA